VVESRLPRVLGAILVGAALSVSGASFQAVFRNPLVSPGLLGVLSGAGFGAALGIVLGGHPALIQLLAFTGGVAAVAVGVGVARLFGDGTIIMLVFGGLISNALFTALLSILKYGADPDDQLPNIVFWLLGSLAQIGPGQLLTIALPLIAGIVLLSAAGRLLDALAMSDDEARTLGVPVTALRYGVILLATILSALTVSLAGMIGWVGLIIPHIARLIVGPGNARLLPLSACIGGIFLLVSDGLARTLFAEEIPIGIITDLLGVAIFLAVLPQARRGWA
jgi:iron complex transport system permease protein